MNPAPSKYSIFYMYLFNSGKDNGILKGSKKVKYKEGAG
jgi:hypothetical protein